MKKLPASSQNAELVRAMRRPSIAAANGLPAAAGRGSGSVAPNGIRPDLGRPVAHEERDEWQDDPEGDEADGDRCVAPSPMGHDRRQDRQEDQLSGGARRGEHTGDEPTALDEPAVRDDRSERDRDRAGGKPVDDPPEDVELPRRGHEDGEAGADRDAEQGADHDPTHPEPLDQRSREGAAEAVEHEVDRDRGADRAAAPTELVLQRHDQDTRRRPEAGSGDQRHEPDGRHDPGVVNAPHQRRNDLEVRVLPRF